MFVSSLPTRWHQNPFYPPQKCKRHLLHCTQIWLPNVLLCMQTFSKNKQTLSRIDSLLLIPSPCLHSERLCVHLLDKWFHAANRPVNYSIRCGWIHPQVSGCILKLTSLRTNDDIRICVCRPPFHNRVCVCVFWSGSGSWGRWWMTS